MSDKNEVKDISTIMIHDLINESGLTREEIAKEFNVDTSTITKYYNGDRKLTLEAVRKFSKLFNVSSDYILGLTKIKTVDKDIKFLCEYTGLNESAVLNLTFRHKNAKVFEDDSAFDFLNYFLDFDEMGFYLAGKIGGIKKFLVNYTKALENEREKNIESLKGKLDKDKTDIESLKEALQMAEYNCKIKFEKDIGYGKYEAEKAFSRLLDDYIENEEREFTKEINKDWQL